MRWRRMIQAFLVLLILQCILNSSILDRRSPIIEVLEQFNWPLCKWHARYLPDAILMAILLPRFIELTPSVVAGIVHMVRVSLLLQKPDFEPIWDEYNISIWTNTEIYVSLVCAAAPGIKLVIVNLLSKVFGTTTRSRTGTTGGSKWKRTRIRWGSKRLKRIKSMTARETADAPYTECWRGADEESLGMRTSRRQSRRGSDIDASGVVDETSEVKVEIALR
ncbi:hypothetical protein BDU57DRAFT_581267 [Ampelomyces quisqualis]|uniref:Integral membrane protein n=1 Tax=Ampelomyces quisqualis TaxID=50730 RepID=A0A6A5QBZ2_AMPQU|nr:hypothetical protein BDU57DRAFT_581267 [Ampelomyces quisqualis]